MSVRVSYTQDSVVAIKAGQKHDHVLYNYIIK